MSALKEDPANDSLFNDLASLPKHKRLIYLAALFREPRENVPINIRGPASRAALELAIASGSNEAKLELGKAYRDGAFGKKKLMPRWLSSTRCSGDAVVRLYIKGQREAVRSMFVRKGESFTANSLAPGASDVSESPAEDR